MTHKFADEVDSLLSSLLEGDSNKNLQDQTGVIEKYQLPIKIGITNKSIDKGDKPWIVGNFAPGKYLNETHPQGHEGIDLKAPIDTPIYPIASGIVIDTSENPKGGKTCKIAHENGQVTSYYAHMSKVNVNVQQQVNQKIAIGIIGQTGNAKGRGEHLHFEVKVDGNKIDPLIIVGKNVGSLSAKKKAEWDQFIGQFVKEAGLIKVPEKLLNDITEFVLSNFCYLVYEEIDSYLKHKEIIKENLNLFGKEVFNEDTINLNLTKNECKKYIKYDYFIRGKTFKYQTHEIIAKITLRINESENSGYYFYDTEHSLHNIIINLPIIDASKFTFPNKLKDEIEEIKRTIRHELEHFMQEIKRYEIPRHIEMTGLPFKTPHEKRYDELGYDQSEIAKKEISSAPKGERRRQISELLRREHDLQDIEFYPILADSISSFKEIWDQYPEAVKEAAAKVWIGLPNNFTGDIATLFHPDHFFLKLKKEQFLKWKKAVKEFWKKVFYDEITV